MTSYYNHALTYQNMQTAIFASIFVATRAPMLPFSGLPTISFFPHRICVVKALRMITIRLQGEIFLGFCEHTPKKSYLLNCTLVHDKKKVMKSTEFRLGQ